MSISLALYLGLWGASCSPKSGQNLTRSDLSKAASEEAKPMPAAPFPEPQPEGVMPPSNITGTFLTCALDKSPSALDPSARVACALNDETTKQKADLSRHISQPSFELKTSDRVQVARNLLADDPRWHVIFTLSAIDSTSVQEALNTATVQVSGTSPDGSRQSKELKASLGSVLQKDTTASTSGGSLYTSVQSLALRGAPLNGQEQLACRGLSAIDRGYHLGRYLPATQSCVFAYDINAETTATFLFIAADPAYVWTAASNGILPTGAVALGNEGNGRSMYLCRAEVVGEGLMFGKFAAGYDGCNLVSANGYLQVNTYQVLSR